VLLSFHDRARSGTGPSKHLRTSSCRVKGPSPGGVSNRRGADGASTQQQSSGGSRVWRGDWGGRRIRTCSQILASFARGSALPAPAPEAARQSAAVRGGARAGHSRGGHAAGPDSTDSQGSHAADAGGRGSECHQAVLYRAGEGHAQRSLVNGERNESRSCMLLLDARGYSRSPKYPALQLLQKSSKLASTTPQRPIWNTFGTVAERDCWENGCRREKQRGRNRTRPPQEAIVRPHKWPNTQGPATPRPPLAWRGPPATPTAR